ncbi:MAG: YfbK domain-containing protein [Coraliomargarita sp.]
MKISNEDPRLTAYALGEIDDPEERSEIEQAIGSDPELMAEVTRIRSMGELLAGGLEREAVPELNEFEAARMGHAPAVEPRRSLVRTLISWPVVTTAAAAALVAMLVLPQVGRVQQEARQMDPIVEERLQEVAQVTEVGFRELRVEIPDERIEGTPQPIRLPNLEPAPTQAPRLLVASTDTAAQVLEAEEALGDLQSSAAEVQVAPALAMRSRSTAEGRAQAKQLSVGGAPAPQLGMAYDSFGAVDPFAPSAVAPQPAPQSPAWNTERYDPIEESDFRSPLVAPLSTFSIDVDTASYANVRRILNQGRLPPADSVRIEELVNYFSYSDAPPVDLLEEGGDPFAVHMAQAAAPWNPRHRLLRVALKAYEMPWAERPASNLVFLLDVSGSMNSPNKLPLVKEAMQLLSRRLDERDRVAIVVYAGASGLVLPSTTANNTETIEHALSQLSAGGSTNAGAGIELAYKIAREHFIENGNNRVILCTDGDFNVGQTNRGDLTAIAGEYAAEGVSLTLLGFGMGNFKDDMLEDLSNKGKGTYAYIDSRAEARKVFLEDLASNIFKVAKDVKIQVEFNPGQVQAYRLIGYENRRLKAEDFNNDHKKAGDIGPGHSIVAFYELIPVGAEFEHPGVDSLRYQKQAEVAAVPGEVATVKLRYKIPSAEVSRLIVKTADSEDALEFDEATEDFRFGAAVAAFGLALRGSESIGEFDYAQIQEIASEALGQDPGGHRSEFTELVRIAEALSKVN